MGGVEPAAELGLELETSLSLYLPFTPIQKKKENNKKKGCSLSGTINSYVTDLPGTKHA